LGGGVQIFDAASLTFDFESTISQTLFFTFAFASTEYPDYVNSEYNDAFAFLLNGQNIALVPGTTDPVAINTVNVGELPGNAGQPTPVFHAVFRVGSNAIQLWRRDHAAHGSGTPRCRNQHDQVRHRRCVRCSARLSRLHPSRYVRNEPPPTQVIPEPSTYLMLASGLGFVLLSFRRRAGQ
jgi:hypothetical protein